VIPGSISATIIIWPFLVGGGGLEICFEKSTAWDSDYNFIACKKFLLLCKYLLIKDGLRAFLGLCYARGLLGANMYDARLLWGGNYGTVFEATMSVNRKAIVGDQL
jgi:hypothetical protein